MVLEIKKNTKVCIQKYPLELIFKVRSNLMNRRIETIWIETKLQYDKDRNNSL